MVGRGDRMFHFNLLTVDVNACGTWLTFACRCEGYCDQTLDAFIVYVSTVGCRWGHEIVPWGCTNNKG
jgi:hypothetical protein